MKIKYPNYLAGLFSPPFIRGLSELRGLSGLREIIVLAEIEGEARRRRSIGGVFNSVYKALWKDYRCEYLYKNAIASQILADRHSHTASLHSEFQVGESRADVVVVNSTTRAYEIKTELDSLDRLEDQLCSYRRAFDETYVVTYTHMAEMMLEAIPAGVGLLVVSGDNKMEEIRAAESNQTRIDPALVFDILRRDEYLEILARQAVDVPEVPNTRIYKVCRDLFLDLPQGIVHSEFVRTLRKRSEEPPPRAMRAVPFSLRFHALTGNFKCTHSDIMRQSPETIFD